MWLNTQLSSFPLTGLILPSCFSFSFLSSGRKKMHLFPRPNVVHEDQTYPWPVSGSTWEERKSFQWWESVRRAAAENHPGGEIASMPLERSPDGHRVEGGPEPPQSTQLKYMPGPQSMQFLCPFHVSWMVVPWWTLRLLLRSFWPPQLPPGQRGTCMPCSQIQQNSPGSSGPVSPLKVVGHEDTPILFFLFFIYSPLVAES